MTVHGIDELRGRMKQIRAQWSAADIDKYEVDSFDECLKPAHNYKQAIFDLLAGNVSSEGFSTPWKSEDDVFKFRQGELTIWSGPSGEGKSLITGQCMLSIVNQGGRVAIASLEMHPRETLARMMMQFHGCDRKALTNAHVEPFLDAVGDSMFVYEEVGDVKALRMLAVARFCRAELNVDHLVIDSLVKCGMDDGDYKAEKHFVSCLQNITKQSGLHIHLVTHKRKGGLPGEIMRKEDVSGTQKLTDMADNVILISRNRRKEEELQKSVPDPEITKKPDTWLRIDKQRHGDGWEGTIGLWFTNGWRFVKKGF